MPFWYLAHAYLVFGSCYCIWLMRNPHQLNFSSIYYIPTWISVMRIWHMRIFPSLKKRMSQGPAVYCSSYYTYCSQKPDGETFSLICSPSFWFNPLLPHVQSMLLSLNGLYLFSLMCSPIPICSTLSWLGLVWFG